MFRSIVSPVVSYLLACFSSEPKCNYRNAFTLNQHGSSYDNYVYENKRIATLDQLQGTNILFVLMHFEVPELAAVINSIVKLIGRVIARSHSHCRTTTNNKICIYVKSLKKISLKSARWRTNRCWNENWELGWSGKESHELRPPRTKCSRRANFAKEQEQNERAHKRIHQYSINNWRGVNWANLLPWISFWTPH